MTVFTYFEQTRIRKIGKQILIFRSASVNLVFVFFPPKPMGTNNNMINICRRILAGAEHR